MIKELEYPSFTAGAFQRISWGAVCAGSIVSLAVLVTLTTLGVGIGLAGEPAAISFGIGGAAWMLLSGIASFFCGGWIAGRLNGIPRISESVIHGIVSWSLTTALLAFVFTTAAAGTLSAAAGLAGFLTLLCGAGASAYGARAGTRVLRPVQMAETHRKHVEV